MSARLFKDDIVFLQRLLKSSSFYSGRLDGIWGPLTNKAVETFEQKAAKLAKDFGIFDSRTESHIRTLHLEAQEAARRFMSKLVNAGIDAKIISGTRTYEEQNALFRRGRYGNPGPKVTNARGGFSNHNFAIAWDIGIFENGKYLLTAQPYNEAADIGLTEDLVWGGSWTRFVDRPHYQLATENSLKDIRKLFERGKPYL